MATLVKFVKDKEGDFKSEITAVFPQIPFGLTTVTAYSHLGQHTGASKDWIKKDTEPATESEYSDLKRELEQIGYTLKVCK